METRGETMIEKENAMENIYGLPTEVIAEDIKEHETTPGFQAPTPETLKRLHEIHVNRYTRRLEQGINVRHDECRHLLALWREVETSGFDYAKLGTLAKSEVLEAVWDEGS